MSEALFRHSEVIFLHLLDESPSLNLAMGRETFERGGCKQGGTSMPKSSENRCLETNSANTATGRLAIVYLPIADLKLDPTNPRLHNPRQIRQIARSLETFGFNVPVLIDSTLKIIAGHGRVLACRQLGWRDVPTIRLEHLSEAQARAYMIADNRLTVSAGEKIPQ